MSSTSIAAILLLLTGLFGSTPAESEGNAAVPTTRADPAATQVFRNPINAGADPTMVYHRDSYYLATTQGDRIRIWRSPSIATLLNAPGVQVWKDDDPSRNQQMWAPALYQFAGHWYIYYTASDGVDANHRVYVIESEGADPMGPYHFENEVVGFGEYAIDGEPFRHNGELYFAWAGPGRGQGGPAQTYVAPMSDPWTISGDPVAVPVAGGCSEVREGPTFLYRHGRTFLTYSTCDTGKPDYQIWMTSLADGADPLDPGAWQQHDGPIFSRNDAAGVYGPGHHFFFTSPDGSQDWIAYHAKNTATYNYHWRTTRAQPFTWNTDGTPDLGQPVALGEDVPLPAGDPGPTSRAINDVDTGGDNFRVSYDGDWSSGTGCGTQCYQGDDHWSGTAGATATYTFTGTQIALLSVRDTGNGIAAISIDGGPEQRVDYYGSPRVGQQLNYLSPKLDPGQHTLRVRVTGEKNPDSDWTAISIDRAEVWP